MSALILDGKALAKTTEEELSVRMAKLKEKTGKTGKGEARRKCSTICT